MSQKEKSTNCKSDGVDQSGISRRSFLKLGGLVGAAAPITASAGALSPLKVESQMLDESVGIMDLQEKMSSGDLTAVELVEAYLRRITWIDRFKGVNSVLEVNPDAKSIAQQLDDERAARGPRGPLHGIPILLKDNIDTGDSMMTTAGSLGLVGDPAPQDATVVERLRAAGAIILGKTNLSEWANFRGFASTSGWSGVGGQTNNPYIIDRNPCGSSSGSAAAVSANLCAAALGTETDGSVICPAGACGVVGIKPTVGLTSRAGVVPISDTQDTVGIHGRSVADAAALLGAMTGVDPRDQKTAASDGHSYSDYTQFLDPNGLQGVRIGVARQLSAGVGNETNQIFEQGLQYMRDAGAELIDVEIPSFDAFSNDSSEIIVLIYEFKRDLNKYLATRTGVPVSNLAEVIEFNLVHFERELAYFGQEYLEFAEAEIFDEQTYLQALATGPQLAGVDGIDAALASINAQALVAPSNSPAWPSDLVNGDCFQFGTTGFAAVAGYPLITVPAGYAFDLPVGITFMGTAWSEPELIKLASGFEAASRARVSPQYRRTLNPAMHVAAFKQGQKPGRSQQDIRRLLGRSVTKKPFYL